MGGEFPRLSGKEMVIIKLLISSGEMYGLQLVNESNGVLKRGTIYVALGRLEDKGYISSRKVSPRNGDSISRRVYKVNGLGARVFHALEGVGGRAWLKEAMA
jgi:DNA-binding PadR family transcriptional regulator